MSARDLALRMRFAHERVERERAQRERQRRMQVAHMILRAAQLESVRRLGEAVTWSARDMFGLDEVRA